MTKIITLKPTKERSAKRFHPWIFSGALSRLPNDIQDGEIVKVVSADKEVLGYGFFGSSSISVKLCTFGDTPISPALWSARIESAYALRAGLGLGYKKNTDMFRLVNAEGDQLPGLIIDVYGDACVVHCHHAGFEPFQEDILNALTKTLDFANTVYWKNIGGESEGGKYLKGSNKTDHVGIENGNKFHIDWETGQKTGFFLDQRDNRRLVGSLSAGKKVLNAFSYSGGFSVYALKQGARLVHSVDSSEKATDLCNKNISLNGLSNHEAIKADCLTYLRDISGKYDLIVLDPPAFAKHKNAVEGAMAGYRDINRLALKALPAGGMLATFSCSQLVSKDMFQESVFTAAAQVGRPVQVIHRLSQSEDHPVSIYHREGEYLKGLILRVA